VFGYDGTEHRCRRCRECLGTFFKIARAHHGHIWGHRGGWRWRRRRGGGGERIEAVVSVAIAKIIAKITKAVVSTCARCRVAKPAEAVDAVDAGFSIRHLPSDTLPSDRLPAFGFHLFVLIEGETSGRWNSGPWGDNLVVI
tara:strand:+ start:323 stop:745 length:423 start_codon:yes stop_codon:yes gene_type:complete